MDLFGRGFFKFVNQLLSSLTGLLPFSIGEFTLYAFIIFIAAFLVYAIISVIMASGKRLYRLFCHFLTLFAVAASVFTSFVVLWGFNYARQPISISLRLDVKPVEKQILYEVCEDLVLKANALRKDVPENDKGVFISHYKKDDILQKTPQIYKDVSKKLNLDIFDGNFGQVKPILYSKGMSYAGLVGIYYPFTGEANINMEVPTLTFLAGALHEAAHQRGFAREDEANFIAYYAGRESGDKDFAYSGTVLALLYAMEELNKTDKNMARTVRSHYSEQLKADVEKLCSALSISKPDWRVNYEKGSNEIYVDFN